MKRFSWFVFFSITAISCLDQPDCYQLNNNVIGLGFKIIGGLNDYYQVKKVHIDGFEKATWDTVGTANVGIYLNPYANELDFALEGYFGSAGALGLLDTMKISLSYTSLVQFVSEDCGERHVFSDLKVLSTDFDEIRVLNTVPTNPATVNLDIYRCPITNILSLDFVGDLPISSIQILPDLEVTVTQKSLSDVWLPLNLSDTLTTYLFKYSDGAPTDSLTVAYKITSKVLSETCGEQTFISELKKVEKLSNFTTITAKADSIHDLPQINFEITR